MRTCECGCGQVPPLAAKTRRSRGHVAGEPIRFCRGHYFNPPTRPRPPCVVDTLVACEGTCGQKIHRARQGICAEGHHPHNGHGLCDTCYREVRLAGALPPAQRTRDAVLDAWVDLAEMGVGFREFGEQHHVSYVAWERLYLRARKAGDPRAVRIDQGERTR